MNTATVTQIVSGDRKIFRVCVSNTLTGIESIVAWSTAKSRAAAVARDWNKLNAQPAGSFAYEMARHNLAQSMANA